MPPIEFNIPQSSVSHQEFHTFSQKEKDGVDATIKKYVGRAETLSPDKRELTIAAIKLLGTGVNAVIDTHVKEGGDLVSIRMISRIAINKIEGTMREKLPAQPSSFNPGPTLPAPGFIERHEMKFDSKYGIGLPIEDLDGRRFARAKPYDPALLPGYDGDTRVYHCYSLGCLPVGDLSQKLSGDTVKEIKERNFTHCTYITHATTDVSPIFQKPIGGVAVGVRDAEVCKTLFLHETGE